MSREVNKPVSYTHLDVYKRQVERIDGDYAYLKRTDVLDDDEKCVARALLPGDINEGSRLAYEMLEYTLL